MALAAVSLLVALLVVATWQDAPLVRASGAPTVAVTGDLAPGNTVTVAGTNWPADDAITITYDGAAFAAASARIHPSIAGSLGGAAFSTQAQIPLATTVGAHTVVAHDLRTGAMAQTSLTVTAEWAQFGFSATGTRYNPYETAIGPQNVASLTPDWTYNTGESSSPGPVVVVGGTIYFPGPYSGDLTALNAATGQVLWTRDMQTGSVVEGANGALYAASTSGALEALDPATGTSLWASAYGGYSGLTIANGMLYVAAGGGGSGGGIFDAYRLAGCAQALCYPVWRYRPSFGTNAPPAVAGGSVYFTTLTSVVALDAGTGAYEWAGGSPSAGELWGAVVDDGYVMVTGNNPNGALPPATGELDVYSASGCGQSFCHPLWSATNPIGWSATPAVANGVIYVGGLDGALYAFSEAGCGQATCAPLWRSAPDQTPARAMPAPVVANGVVYFMNWDPGAIEAFAAVGCGAATCAPLWSFAIAGGVTGETQPAIVNGMLYAFDSNGVLCAFHLPTTASRGRSTPAKTVVPHGSGQPTRIRPYVFRYQPPGDPFALL